jgi:hypothetical protein
MMPYAAPAVAAVVRLQELTRMRPNEVIYHPRLPFLIAETVDV